MNFNSNKQKKTTWKYRFVSVLLCLAIVLTFFQLTPNIASAAEGELTPANAFAVKNGDFSNGLDYWEEFVAPADWGAYDINANWTEQADGLQVNIKNTGVFHADAANWDVLSYPNWLISLKQEDVALSPGLTYQFSANINSDIARYVTVGIEQNDGTWKLWEQDFQLQVGNNSLSAVLPGVTTAFKGRFYIHIGHNSKDTSTYSEHNLKFLDIRLEVNGARDTFLLVKDNTFTNTAKYSKSNNVATSNNKVEANVTNLGTSADSTYIQYSNLAVEAGKEYKLQFAARAENTRNIQCVLGTNVVADNVTLNNYTKNYVYRFTATNTGTMSLKFNLGNVTGASTGRVFIDNIGLWSNDTDIALGIGFKSSDILLPGAVITATSARVCEGKNVTFTVATSDLNAWKAAAKTLYINKNEVAGNNVSIDGNNAVVSGNAFAGSGTYKVSIRANGFEESNQVSLIVLPGNGNVLKNGSFAEGLSGWTNFILSGCSNATVTADHKLNIHTNWWNPWSWDNNPPYSFVDWQTMLNQNVSLESGKTYVVAFTASSSISRPIGIGMKDQTKKYVKLSSQPQEYQVEITATSNDPSELQLTFGYMTYDGLTTPGNQWSEGMPAVDISHDIYISDIIMTDKANLPIVYYPTIGGVDSGGTYRSPVTPSVYYKTAYTVSLYKADANGNYVKQNYTEGNTVSQVGSYKIEAVSTANSSVKTTKVFTIAQSDINYSQQFYIIKSRSNSKTVTANGVVSGAAAVQNLYKENLNQFFTKESTDGNYFILRSASSGKVITVQDNSNATSAKIVLDEYDSTNKYHQWYLKSQSQGFYSIINRGSSLAIDIPASSSDDGIQLQQYTSNGSNAQQWDIVEMDLQSIMNPEAVPDTSAQATWIKNAIKYPSAGKLVPAGPIYLQWYNNNAMGNVSKYEITVDGQVQGTVTATAGSVMEYQWYSTEVAAHTVAITAILADGSKVTTNTRNFYVSKKGIGWSTLYRTEDMDLSWYYQWSTDPSAGTDKNLEFVPMIWGNWGSTWLNNTAETSKHRAVLGFNEPDFATQSNVLVADAIAAWPEFVNTGLRLGSPVTAIPAPYTNTIYLQESSKDWFYTFMDAVGNDVDFVVLHDYDGGGSAEAFIKMVDDTWNTWHKPIWISEFGVANWSEALWNSGVAGASEKVTAFMAEVLPALDARPYVERYAWFPFDPNDEWGGSSGIFDYSTGQLNALGDLYASLGLPGGYTGDPVLDTPAAGTVETVATPVITPATGTYTTAQTVTIADTTAGAIIRYTTDGSTPTETSGTVYSGAFNVAATSTVKAIAYKTGMTNSNIATSTITINTAPVTTNIALNKTATALTGTASEAFDGNVNTRWNSSESDPQWITVDLGASYSVSGAKLAWETAAGKDYKIQVSADNATWTDAYTKTNGTGGTENITFTTPVTGRYVRMYGTARVTGYGYSLWEMEVYGTQGGTVETVSTPAITPATGTYTDAQTVTISDSTAGATIRYTTDGSTPTATSGTVYSGAFNVAATATVKAIAYKSGMNNSSVVTSTITINTSPVTTNVALNKTATALTGTASEAFDGSVNSRWESASSDPQWITVDLGANYSVTGAKLVWETAAGKDYKIQVSVDNATWTDAYTKTNGIGGTENITFAAPVTGRYVRMYGTARVTGYGYSLWEMEVYGTQGGTVQTVATPAITPATGTYTAAQTVTISDSTAGATIRYTTDGSTPTATTGTVYSGAFTVASTATVKAIAYKSGMNNSSVVTSVITINSVVETVATPAITPATGTYTAAQTVTISDSTAGATIRYTTDGSTPTATTGTVYSGAFDVASTATVKAIAYKSGMNNSSVVTSTITINTAPVTTNVALNKTATALTGTASEAFDGSVNSRWESASSDPQWITVDLGASYSVTGSKLVWETAAGKDYKIQVSADNATWTDAYTKTNGIGGTENITFTTPVNGRYVRMYGTARTTGYGYSLWEFEVYGTQGGTVETVSTPTITPATGTYPAAQTVTIADSTAGATIRYTTDGSTPTATNGTVYSGAFTVATTATVKAIAYKSGMNNSSVASSVITITTTPPVSTNVALNKTATAYSVRGGNTAAMAIDSDNVNTRWESDTTDPQWITIDLGTSYTLTGAKLIWETAAGKDYKIQVSNDNATWTDAYTKTNGTGGTENITFTTPVTGRYVRMYGTARTTGYGYSLWGFEIYN